MAANDRTRCITAAQLEAANDSKGGARLNRCRADVQWPVVAFHTPRAAAGAAFAPVDPKVYFLRPVSPDGRDLVAQGSVIHRGRSVATGTSEIFDADGRKVAVASGSALILPGRP